MILRTLFYKHAVALGVGIAIATLFCAWIAWTSMQTRYVTITMTAQQPIVAQVFFDRGRGFNTVDMAYVHVAPGEEARQYRFRLPNVPLQTLLLAPLNTPGSVTIHDIGLENGQAHSLQRVPDIEPQVLTAQTPQEVNELLIELPFSFPLAAPLNMFLLCGQIVLAALASTLVGIIIMLVSHILSYNSRILTIAVLLIGISLRLFIGVRGHNFDFDSWKIVAQIAAEGGNVYVETTRYNYGPVWLNILGIFQHFAALVPLHAETVFRYCIISLLTLTDLGIFVILFRRYGHHVAHLFFLNPISIIITGYHNQFGNLALLFGMAAIILLEDDSHQKPFTRLLWAILLLGVSLMTKHILFLFPVWLLLKQQGWRQKTLILLIPVSIFFLGFLPYWGAGQASIIQNVFRYASSPNEPFYQLFVPQLVQLAVSSKMVWGILLVLGAWVFRKSARFDSLLLYTAVFIVASPAIVNQYLALVIPYISRYSHNVFFAIYTVAAFIHLLTTGDGLHVQLWHSGYDIGRHDRYAILVVLLGFGVITQMSGQHLSRIAKHVWHDIRQQFAPPRKAALTEFTED